MYLKSTYFHNLVFFSDKNYKKQAQMFYQNHSLALRTDYIFCNLVLRNVVLGLEHL